MQRGIISAPARVHGNGTAFQSEGGLSIEDIRYFLLYWDKVVIPTTNLVHLAVPEEEEILRTGLVTRPRVPFGGTFNGELIAKAQIVAQTAVARDLILNDKQTDWVLHQIGDEFILPDTETIEKQSIRVQLINALPVPSGEVAIPDILEFKERRKDELLRLHQSIDELYFEILLSPDPCLKTKAVVSQLSDSIVEVNRVATERWKSTTKFDISTELNLIGKDVVVGVSTGAAFDFFANLYTLPIGTIAGAIVSTMKITAKATKSFEPSKEKQVLSYLAKAHQERILREYPTNESFFRRLSCLIIAVVMCRAARFSLLW